MSGTSRTFCLLPIGATGRQLPDHPHATEIVTAQGNPFILKSGVKILYPEGNEKMQRNAQFLADYLKTATGKDFAIEAGTEGKNAIVLTLGTANENPESYQLKVTGDGITITGPTEAGVFYGIQSLRKSLPVAVGADISMPAVEINDAPALAIVAPTSTPAVISLQ